MKKLLGITADLSEAVADSRVHKLYRDRLDSVGVMAYPLEFMAPKLPGLGDVRWDKYMSALTDIGYDGCVCIEVEDKAFEGSREKILDSLQLSYRYIRQYVI